MKKLLLSLAIFLTSIVVTNAQLLTETFTYADGSIVGATGSPWTTNSGTAGQQDVVSGELFLNDNESEDIRAPFSSDTTSGIISASFQLRIDTNDVPTSANGDYIAHFIGDTDANGIPGDFIGRIFTRVPAVVATGAFRLGIANSTGTGTSAVYFATDLAAGTNYNLTLSYNFTTSTASLNVTGLGTVTATDTAAAITRISAFGFRQTTATGDQFVDNLTVAVPEPSTYAMLVGGAGLMFVVMRRKRVA